jgi:hypothetical protein
LNPYVAYEGYVVRVPHNPLMRLIGEIFADSRRYIRMTEKDIRPLWVESRLNSHFDPLTKVIWKLKDFRRSQCQASLLSMQLK